LFEKLSPVKFITPTSREILALAEVCALGVFSSTTTVSAIITEAVISSDNSYVVNSVIENYM